MGSYSSEVKLAFSPHFLDRNSGSQRYELDVLS